MDRENVIACGILDAAFKVHRTLGPGLFESVYEAAMAYELDRLGLTYRAQYALPVVYETIRLERGFRVDLFVEQCVIVEVKSIPAIAPVHTKQVLTYLRLADVRLGLLLNFGAALMREGIKRIAN